MRPLTITLPPEAAAMVASGAKRSVSHRRNPRIDRYFSAKSPDVAVVNGIRRMIVGIRKTDTDWVVYFH